MESDIGGERRAELKPCPFCGSSNVYIEHNNDDEKNVHCLKCGASVKDGWFVQTIESLIRMWNRRDREPRKCCANCKHTDVTWCLKQHKEIEFRDNACEHWEGDE